MFPFLKIQTWSIPDSCLSLMPECEQESPGAVFPKREAA